MKNYLTFFSERLHETLTLRPTKTTTDFDLAERRWILPWQTKFRGRPIFLLEKNRFGQVILLSLISHR